MGFLRGLFNGKRGTTPDAIASYAAHLYREMRAGTEGAIGDRRFRIEAHSIGNVVLPSGRLAACDPWIGRDVARPFQRDVAAGEYPVEVRVAVFEEGSDQRVACALVRIGRSEPTAWEPAQEEGERRRRARDIDDVLGYPVDTGTGCFASPEALAALAGMSLDGTDNDPLDQALEASYVATWSHASLEVGPKLNVVAFSTGYGDGVYATFWGMDAEGTPVCAVTDFGFVDPDAAG